MENGSNNSAKKIESFCVLVCAHNEAEHIEAVVRTAREQGPCQVVVVDDGSTDNTADVVSRVSRQSKIKIRYIYQENRGASAARNRGIAEAGHDLLCFLDSDDWWDCRKLEYQSDAMQRQPQYLISHTRELWYRKGKKVNQKNKHAPPHGRIFSRHRVSSPW